MEDTETFDENFLFDNFELQDEQQQDQDHSKNKPKSRKARKRKLSERQQEDEHIDYNAVTNVAIAEFENIISQKDKYINELEQQNNKLKAVVKRLCGPQSFSEDDGGWERGALETMPIAVVLLLNNEISQAHGRKIEEYLRYVSEEDVGKEAALTQNVKAQSSAVPLRAFSVSCKGKRAHKSKARGHDKEEPHVLSAIQYFRGFLIDRTGLPLLENDPGITECWSIPSYEQVFLKALPIGTEASKVLVRQKRTKTCFNCGKEHNLSDCTEPRDHAKINAARQEYSTKFGSPGRTPDSRYHVSQAESGKYSHIKAGDISESLREALGIKGNDLPPYIYKMRLLGYPPGYLQRTDSELVIYGAEGEIQDHIDGEEGEIRPEEEIIQIEYPGFNAVMPEGIKDRSIEFGMPPFRPDFDYRRHGQSPGMSNQQQRYDDYNGEREAKRMRLDRSIEDMDVADNEYHSDSGRPPLPLIEMGDYRPPPPTGPFPPLPQSPWVSPPYRQQPPLPAESPPTDSSVSTIDVEDLLERAEKEAKKAKIVDTYLAQGDKIEPIEDPSADSSHRPWWTGETLVPHGTIYFTCTPPPAIRAEIKLEELPKKFISELDREPWKTDSTSWYDPLYGDLATPTGIYDSIREILKRRKRKQRKLLKSRK